jgi:hypothetical protein
MAQYMIEHSCGHTHTHHIFGRSRDRNSKQQWLAARLCPDCWAQQKEEQRTAENTAAEQWAAGQKLPVLVGSEKQCAWAETLRRKELREVCEALARVGDEFPEGSEGRAFAAAITEDAGRLLEAGVFADWLEDEGDLAPSHSSAHARLWMESREAKLPAVLRGIAWLAAQADAHWWIDHRYGGWRELVRDHVEEPERKLQEEAGRLHKEQEARAAQERRVEEAKVALAAAQEKARADALAAIAAKAKLHESQRGWLRRLGELIGHEPADLILIRANTQYGWRVLVNEGNDRYAREHLVDYRPAEGVLKLGRELVGKKKELLSFCIDFWALNPSAETFYSGKALFAGEGGAK